MVIDQYPYVPYLLCFSFLLSRSHQFWFELHGDRSVPSSSISYFSIRIPLSHLFWFDLHGDRSIPSCSISFHFPRFFYLDLTIFYSTYMVIVQYLHCIFLTPDLIDFYATYMVIDPDFYLPLVFFFIFVFSLPIFDNTNMNSTVMVLIPSHLSNLSIISFVLLLVSGCDLRPFYIHVEWARPSFS